MTEINNNELAEECSLFWSIKVIILNYTYARHKTLESFSILYLWQMLLKAQRVEHRWIDNFIGISGMLWQPKKNCYSQLDFISWRLLWIINRKKRFLPQFFFFFYNTIIIECKVRDSGKTPEYQKRGITNSWFTLAFMLHCACCTYIWLVT